MTKSILPEASEYQTPKLTNEDWQELEIILDRDLEVTIRHKIEDAMNNYSVGCYFLHKNKSHKNTAGRPKGKATPTSRYRRNLKRLIQYWHEIQNDEPSRALIDEFADELAMLTKSNINLKNVMVSLEVANQTFGCFTDSAKKKENPIKVFIRAIAKIFKEADIPVTNRRDYDINLEISPFVHIIIELDKKFPVTSSHTELNKGTWSNLIWDSLKIRE